MTFIPGSSTGSGSYDWDEITTVGSNTWTVPSGVKLVYVTLVGGGGGGAGGYNSGQTAASAGAGGAGKVFYRVPLPVTAGASLSINIGAGGAGSAGAISLGTAASDGSASSISMSNAVALSASGGKGGSTSGASGASGSGASPSGSSQSFGGTEQIATALGGVVYASASGGSVLALRTYDPALTLPSANTGGTAGGAASTVAVGHTGGFGWNLVPTPIAAVAGGNYVSGVGAAGGRAPGYGGGGGGGGQASNSLYAGGTGGTGQQGYCLIEWGL